MTRTAIVYPPADRAAHGDMLGMRIPTYDLVEFSNLIARDPALLTRHPCVVRGFTGQWPASRTWVDLDTLAAAFGDLPVTAGAPQFTTNKTVPMCQVRTDFGTYIRYVQEPRKAASLFDGKWVKGDLAAWQRSGLPLYCGNMRLVRHAREAVLREITPLTPGSFECLNDQIPYFYQSGNHVWLYVSLAGALTPLHQDNNAVISYLGQLSGEKEAILYSPEDKPHFYTPGVGYLDPSNPDDAQFPTWREARPWTATLTPGDLLIWGPNWAHRVVTLSNSVTVSFDIVNRCNLVAYTRSDDWRDELGRFARKNAALVRARIADAEIDVKLEHATESDLGRAVMLRVLRAALDQPLTEQSRWVKTTMRDVLEAEHVACEAMPIDA